jgi:hypothetical protein
MQEVKASLEGVSTKPGDRQPSIAVLPAEALRVRTVLEGSVRRAGNRIRVTAQLINAEDGYHL